MGRVFPEVDVGYGWFRSLLEWRHEITPKQTLHIQHGSLTEGQSEAQLHLALVRCLPLGTAQACAFLNWCWVSFGYGSGVFL